MLMDARGLPDQTQLECDVCIVGAGAAGISLAMQFAGAKFRVLLVEGGGLKFEHRSTFLHRGQNSGRPYQPLEVTHRRQFGGTTASWFGRCRPLDPVDFERRAWLPHSGWPFSRSELDPFIPRAYALCQVPPPIYLEDGEALPGSGLQGKLFYFSPPTHFGNAYLAALEGAGNIRSLIHANAVEVVLDPDGRRVSQLRLATLNGKHHAVSARILVLAASGLENPRLLLASRSVHAAGVGNQNDLVGRYFMEHVFCFSAAITSMPPGFPAEFLQLDYDTFQRKLKPTPAIGLPEPGMESQQLLNACAFFVRRAAYKLDDAYFSRRLQGFLNLTETVRHRLPHSRKTIQHIQQAIVNSGPILHLLARAAQGKLQSAHGYALHIQSETVPNPESRVKLSTVKDRLGLNQLEMQWRLSAQDLDSYKRFEHELHHRMVRCGFQLRKFKQDLDSDGWPIYMTPGGHLMGTTRMSDDPHQGVVDRDCRVHGVSNLYVAGSSVFPTSGMANPTLTLVALAVRLANHIKQVLA